MPYKPLTKKNRVMKNLVDQINAQVAAFQANAAAQVEKNNKAAGMKWPLRHGRG